MWKKITLIITALLLQQVQAQEAGTIQSFEVFEGMRIEMAWIPPGSFQMGNTTGIEDRWSSYETAHPVTLTEGFWMARLEVTQELWQTVMGSNPSETTGEQFPVTNVSWHDAMAFINQVQRFDPKFDLPTEAQWEHAAKAGTNKNYSLPRDEITWHKENSGVKVHVVGEKKPNLWGLYDIHGNVGEWTKDWFAAFESAPQSDPVGPATGERKMIKGGQFTGRPRHTQSFDRQSGTPDIKRFYVGFRLMRAK